MKMLVVLLAILGWLTIGWAQEENKAYVIEVPNFTPYVKGIISSEGVIMEDGYVTLTAGEEGTEFCKKLVCMGKIYNVESAKIPSTRGVSFHTNFIFSMKKSRADSVAGDGFVFFLTAHPHFAQGQPNGMFGIFTEIQDLAEANPMFGIEFDTMKNVDLDDSNDNHVGVNINSAVSVRTASADAANVQLNDGQRIMAWIDYDKSQNVVETRIAYDSPDIVKPTQALLTYKYDINEMRLHHFWVGFSASSNFGFEQSHQIYSWNFNAMFDAPAPALNDTEGEGVSWARLLAYSLGGTVAAGIGWYCVVKYTKWGKATHAQCMKFIPNKLLAMIARLKKKDDTADEEKGAKPGAKVPPTTTTAGKPMATSPAGVKAPPAAASDSDDDDEEDEEDASLAPPIAPGAKPPPPPPKHDDEEEDEEDEGEEDDDDDDDLPPPPGGRMPPPPPPFKYPPPPPPPQPF